MVLKWVQADVWQFLGSSAAKCEIDTARLMQRCRVMAQSGLARGKVNAWGEMTS